MPRVVLASDRLVIGPSRRDVQEHIRARAAWWRSSETWDHLYSAEVRWTSPVVVWVSTSLHERVNLWRACNWLRHLDIAHRDILILEFHPVPSSRRPERPEPLLDCTASVADHPGPVLVDRLAQARPWPRARFERAVRLWDRYVDANPAGLVRSCIRGIKGFPELAPLWSLVSSFIPRKTSAGALSLSRFDELLLTILSAQWQTPLSIFACPAPEGVQLRQLLSCTGDQFLLRRLEQWAHHHAGGVVERGVGPRPDLPMKSHVYRITGRGARLREGGLEQLADAPALPLGGMEAYAPSAPWVLLEEGRLARG